jgi:hypothetical protein
MPITGYSKLSIKAQKEPTEIARKEYHRMHENFIKKMPFTIAINFYKR